MPGAILGAGAIVQDPIVNQVPVLTRSAFVRRASATAAPLAAHESLPSIAACASQHAPVNDGASGEPLIGALRLVTATPLETMRDFYRDKIGVGVIEQSDEFITFAGGATALTFVKAWPDQIRGVGGRGRGEPMYHFAFNIPHDTLRAARTWQLQRTPLVPPHAGLLDPACAEDVWHFRQWNAHSVFFFDPAINIVEYIARHDLISDSPDASAFTAADIIYANEIGYIVSPAEQEAAARTV